MAFHTNDSDVNAVLGLRLCSLHLQIYTFVQNRERSATFLCHVIAMDQSRSCWRTTGGKERKTPKWKTDAKTVHSSFVPGWRDDESRLYFQFLFNPSRTELWHHNNDDNNNNTRKVKMCHINHISGSSWSVFHVWEVWGGESFLSCNWPPWQQLAQAGTLRVHLVSLTDPWARWVIYDRRARENAADVQQHLRNLTAPHPLRCVSAARYESASNCTQRDQKGPIGRDEGRPAGVKYQWRALKGSSHIFWEVGWRFPS